MDYAANQGIEWVVLTNANTWRVFRVIFGKPIDKELVLDIDHLQLNAKSADDLEAVRRELRRLSDVRVELADLREAFQAEVLKREVTECEKAADDAAETVESC